MNFIRNRNFRAGPQTSLEGFICPQNSDKQQKIKVFGRSGGDFRNFLVERNILVRNFSDFINENPQSVNILYINITKKDSPLFLRENESVDNENTEKIYKGKKVKG